MGIRIFTAFFSFVKAEDSEQPTCSPTGDWGNKRWRSPTGNTTQKVKTGANLNADMDKSLGGIVK